MAATDPVVGLANEGVPVRVIARAFALPAEFIRERLLAARDAGSIAEVPREDWPATGKIADRVPQVSGTQKQSTPAQTIACQRAFKLTKLEASFMVVLMQKDRADKETLHRVIEALRATRATRPDNPDPTDPKMVDVVICKLRKKIGLHGIKIHTLWGSGYYIDKPSRECAREVMDRHYGDASVEETAPTTH